VEHSPAIGSEKLTRVQHGVTLSLSDEDRRRTSKQTQPPKSTWKYNRRGWTKVL